MRDSLRTALGGLPTESRRWWLAVIAPIPGLAVGLMWNLQPSRLSDDWLGFLGPYAYIPMAALAFVSLGNFKHFWIPLAAGCVTGFIGGWLASSAGAINMAQFGRLNMYLLMVFIFTGVSVKYFKETFGQDLSE